MTDGKTAHKYGASNMCGFGARVASAEGPQRRMCCRASLAGTGIQPMLLSQRLQGTWGDHVKRPVSSRMSDTSANG